MKVLNRTIEVRGNKRNRTFTIRLKDNLGITYTKYRTIPFSKHEFKQAELFWTQNEWDNFLKSDDYYTVK